MCPSGKESACKAELNGIVTRHGLYGGRDSCVVEVVSMLQLNPMIPMWTPKGEGYAFLVIDYSQEHNLLWVVALNDGGEVWAFPNKDIRLMKNFSMGRTKKVEDKTT